MLQLKKKIKKISANPFLSSCRINCLSSMPCKNCWEQLFLCEKRLQMNAEWVILWKYLYLRKTEFCSVCLVWLSLFCAHGVRVESTLKNPLHFRAVSCVVNCDFKATLGWPLGQSKDAPGWAPSLLPCTKQSAQEEGIMQRHFFRMFSQLLTICGSRKLPRAVFHSPY